MKKQELFNNEAKGFPYQRHPKQPGLYDAAYEHDACGVGMCKHSRRKVTRHC